MSFRRFVLQRDVDESGVSGVGVVAEGVEFSNGVVALQWTSRWPTSVVFHDRGMESVEAVHGHGGLTRIVWLDKPPMACTCRTVRDGQVDVDEGAVALCPIHARRGGAR